MRNEDMPAAEATSQDLTLSQLLTQRCQTFAASDKAVEIIDQGIEKLFKDLISDAFRSYGDFGKLLTEAFKGALPTNISEVVDLPAYNSMVINSVRESWASSGIETDMQQQVQKLVEEFTSDKAIPKYVLASDLWGAFIKDHEEQAAEENWDSPQVFFEESDSCDGYFTVGIHPEPESLSRYSRRIERAFSCDFYFSFSPENENGYRSPQLTHEGHPVYSMYAGKVDNGILGKKISKAYSRFDKLIAALYYGGSYLVLDVHPEDADMTYPHHDY